MNCKLFLSVFLVSLIYLLALSEPGLSQDSTVQPVTSTQILQTSTTWNNEKIQYPATESAEITALHIEFAPGSETTWHRHPAPSLAYILSGELEVTLKDGKTRIYQQGDAFAEVVNTWHFGKNIGKEPVRLVVFYVGEEGMTLTELLSEVEVE